MSRPGAAWGRSEEPERLERRLVITPEGRILARSGKVEYGQGIRTGFARIVARELRVAPEDVTVELGETDRVPFDFGTFGSMSTATDGEALRRAAAYAMELLRARAASLLGVGPEGLVAQGGALSAPDGRSVSYQAIVVREPLAGEVPPAQALAFAPEALPALPSRREALALVRGEARFPHDVRLPGMLRGHMVRPPHAGARPLAVDESALGALSGHVRVVRGDGFVGVLSERGEQAIAGAAALRVRWQPSAPEQMEPVEQWLRRDEGVEESLDGGRLRYDARFFLPHVAHASILPSAAAADVRDGEADLYVATQRPFALRREAAEILGLPQDAVRVHPQQMSGMYGGGGWHEAALDAVQLSQAARRPVLVTWTRREEFQETSQRPILEARVSACVSEDGRIAAWRYRSRTNPHIYGGGRVPPQALAATSGRNAVPPYDIRRAEVLLEVVPGAVPTGAFRSLAAAPNVFAIESTIDELAALAGQDPIDFRLHHASDPRLTRVLREVANLSGWHGREVGPGRGAGVACAVYHGTYVAEVAQVSVSDEGEVRVARVFAAVDPGRLVHPDGARSQIEGGIVQAMSWTLFEETTVQDGRIQTRGWREYPIARFRDAPREIHVSFVGDDATPSTGVGEPGSVPIAAAIANAVRAATGARVARLPLRPADVLEAIRR